MQQPLLIYTPQLSTRLDYICKFLFRDILKIPFVFTTSLAKIENTNQPFINYSNIEFANGFQILPHTLLFEKEVTIPKITIEFWQNLPVFFVQKSKHFTFDILAASFYLLSRMEEYTCKEVDEYERFPHTKSLAFLHQFLQQPLINEWAHAFASSYAEFDTNFIFAKPSYTMIRTLDADMLFAYKQKGVIKNWGGVAKSFLQGKITETITRIKVLCNLQKDPFDTLGIISTEWQKTKQAAIYFFITANKNSKFDNHVLPHNTSMKEAVNNCAQLAEVGLHPSYQSHDSSKQLQKEKANLEAIANLAITKSRQHYIKFNLPHTFQTLLKQGFEQDYSMGYGSINGFRASTCTPHYWFDVTTNKPTTLQLFPFCWMDANCKFEQKLSITDSKKQWLHYHTIVAKNGGVFIDIWHNFITSETLEGKEWIALLQETNTIATS